MWTVYAISSLLATIVCITLGIVVYLRNRSGAVNSTFGNVSILMGFWSLFPCLTDIAASQGTAVFYARCAYLAALFTPAAFFHFVFAFLGTYEKKDWVRKGVCGSYIISFLFLPFSFSDLLIRDVVRRAPGSYVIGGPLYPWFIIFFIAFCPVALYQIYAEYQASIGHRREQLKFLLLGFLVALLAGGVHLFAPYVNLEIIPHDFLLIAWSAIITYAIIRHRLLDIRIAVASAAIALILYTAILGIPFWIGLKFGCWICAMITLFVTASTGPFIYYRLQKKAAAILLAQQRRYQDILLQASAGMLKEHDLDRLVKLIVLIIKRTVKIKFVAAFLNDTEERCYRLHYIRDNDRKAMKGEQFPYGHPLVKFIDKNKVPFMYDEFPDEVRAAMKTDLDIHLVIPSCVQDKMLGFLCLGAKEDKTMYTDDDMSIFMTLSNQAALAVENCIFMEEFRKSQEKLFTAEKLASVGGMADGLAHQLKNRLNLFSMAAGELMFEVDDMYEKHKDYIGTNETMKGSMEYLKEGLGQINTNVKRTNSIIQGILNFARTETKETFFSEFGVTELVNQGLELARIKHQTNDIPLKLDIDRNDTVYGVKSQLQEVFYNLIDNSYEAIAERMEKNKINRIHDEGYAPEIVFKLLQTEKGTLVEVKDNGMGIKEENIKKVFAPFFTTKSSYKSGSGIGMYVVRRMVEENHNGKIWFTTEYGRGTRVFLMLPYRKARVAV